MELTMRREFLPTADEIRVAFEEEVATLGGTVRDTYADEVRLILRAVLPTERYVRPHDLMNTGVALRVEGPSIDLYPYTFREVCTNGAIVAHSTGHCAIERVLVEGIVASAYDVARTLVDVRAGVQACASGTVTRQIFQELRESAVQDVDVMLNLMPYLGRLTRHSVSEILHRFHAAADTSRFGLMNAVTSLARDTKDPVERWDLEMLGGSMAARVRNRPRITTGAALMGA